MGTRRRVPILFRFYTVLCCLQEAGHSCPTPSAGVMTICVELQEGFLELQEGFLELQEGFLELQEGSLELQEGSLELQEGSIF